MKPVHRYLTSLLVAVSLTFGMTGTASAIDTNPMHDGGGSTEVPDTDAPVLRDDLEAAQWHLDAIRARSLDPDSGAGVTVAVLADGVWSGHPDLVGRVLDGWDIGLNQPIPTSTARTPGDNGGTVGTFAAALIAGSSDGAGVRGVAPAAKILPVVVDNVKSYNDKQVAAGVDWATANGADVIVYIGGLSAALIDTKEEFTCRSISDARRAGIPTFVASGSDWDYSGIEPKYFAARCTDAVAVAPLSSTLGEANGFRNVITPAFSAPTARVVSALAQIDWLPYTTDDQAEWAPVIAAGAAAVLMGRGADADSMLRSLSSTASDIGAAGPDGLTGAGLIDLAAATGQSDRRDAARALADATAASVPRIQTVSIDESGNTGLNWEPPAGVTVVSYRVDVSRWTGKQWNTISFSKPGTDVRAVIPVSMDSQSYVTLTAITAEGSRTSAPVNSYTITPFEPPASPYAKVTQVVARWTDKGIAVTITTNTEGDGADWYLSLLDGWTNQPLQNVKVPGKNRSYLILVNTDAELRVQPLFVIASINQERTYQALLPQYLIDATGYSAGRNHAAVAGKTDFACMTTIGVTSGCEGATVKVVDSRTGKILARSQVMSDKTFTIVFPWKGTTLRVHAVIEDPAHTVRSKPIVRALTYRKRN
jgi:hypothetical protein